MFGYYCFDESAVFVSFRVSSAMTSLISAALVTDYGASIIIASAFTFRENWRAFFELIADGFFS